MSQLNNECCGTVKVCVFPRVSGARANRELNPIERYWCQATCGYGFEALKATAPDALALVTNASIRGWQAVRTTHAYSAGLRYGTERFKQNAYKSHR